MEYNSFYGGRRGTPFIIAAKFSTIDEMITAFSQGGDYKTVNYDEYVIIDAPNKNDRDNGKIYKRGYEYNNEMGGAVYEGQIVGPAGMAPHTEIHTYNEVEQIKSREGFEYRRGKGKYDVDNGSVIPGKYIEPGSEATRFNDSIQWTYCSVRDENSHESTANIGFTFPYPVIDFTISNENPLGSVSIERTDDESHPFYEQWHIKLPVQATSSIGGREDDEAVSYLANSMPPYSIWFIVEGSGE